MLRFWTTACLGVAAGVALNGEPALAQTAGPASMGEASDVVIVLGDRQRDDPGAYSIIGALEVEAVHADHPAEILNTVAGVNVQMNSGQENLIAIRSPVLTGGAAQGSFLLLENGVQTRAPAFGNVNALFELHHEIADAIEVVRGPGSAKYGSNAVHGLVNVLAPEPGGTGISATLSANTLQRYRADLTARLQAAGGDHFAALSLMDDAGWRATSGVDQQKLTLRSRYSGADWSVVSNLAAVNLNQETAGFIQGPEVYRDEDIAKSNPSPEAYRDAWAARASLAFERNLSNGAVLQVTPYGIMQRMIFIQHFLPDQSTEKNGHDALGLMARYSFGAPTLRWTLGSDLTYASGYLREIQSRPTFGVFPRGLHYDYDVDVATIAGYAELDWSFAPAWRLLAGLRGETHRHEYTTNLAPGTRGRFLVPPSRTDDYGLLTPKLGVTYAAAPDLTFYANLARGERAPQASDLYRLQNRQTIEPLDVETLDSVEAGMRGVAGGLTFDVAVYSLRKDNFFFRDSDGLNVPNGKTEHVGIETMLNGELGAGFYWNANVTWSDQTYAFDRDVGNNSEDIVNGTQIDTAPEWLSNAGFGWRGRFLSLFATVEHVGGYFTNAANTAAYDGHTIAHLRGAWTFSDALEAFINIRNLTDERYADRADFAFGNDRYFPGEPLNATLGVRVRR